MERATLSRGWQLREHLPGQSLDAQFALEDGWLPGNAPGTVQQDLLAAGRIPDPFVGLNEHEVQWVGERDWLYRCRFDLPAGIVDRPSVDLCFDGLDTFATVWLNGREILQADNQFVPHRVPVKALLLPEGNELRILFRSALREGREREARHGKRAVWNGDPSRVYVRKAGYHYGWDWGPCLLTAGPWREVRIEGYAARIAGVHCPAEVAPDLRSAALPVALEVAGGSADGLEVGLELRDPDGAVVDAARLPVRASRVQHRFTVGEPRLWWPRGHGGQPLYRLSATLLRGDEELDRREVRLGLRRLRLVQEPVRDEPGQSFLFEVNNAPIFGGGYNWIPADSFPPRVAAERYRDWLELAAEGNAAMLRVWGGGYYEDDVFYDLCDELGLLVWQDFMFACGVYPAHQEFLANVRREAEAAVGRLRHHPSIVLWCGNNEDYQIAQSHGLYDPAVTGDLAAGAFPAREIYERLLPEVCARLDPARPYWPGSPYGGANPNDPTLGDRHVWDIWHGAMSPYQEYPNYRSRFVSEFGMAAAPDLRTIGEFAPPEERYPESRTLDHHNKAAGGPRRIAAYLSDNVRMPHALESYVFSTQLVQAEALAAGVRGWRRRWRGPGEWGCAGALVWQLNDCWPVTSWAVVDYQLRPKAAYYVLKRELQLIVVGLAPAGGGVEAWAVNGGGTPLSAMLQLSAWTLDGEEIGGEARQAALPPYRSTELGLFVVPRERPVVVGARLVVGGAVVSQASAWPEPFKYLDLPDPRIEVERLADGLLAVRAARPAKCVMLSADNGARFDDNALDLLPGDEQRVAVRGLGEARVDVNWLRG